MKKKLNKRFLQLLIIAFVFFIVAFCGFITKPVSDSLSNALLCDSELLLIILLPFSLMWELFNAFCADVADIFIIVIPLISGLTVIFTAIIARFVFSPNKGNCKLYRILIIISCSVARISAILYPFVLMIIISFFLIVPGLIWFEVHTVTSLSVFISKLISGIFSVKELDEISASDEERSDIYGNCS